MLFTEIKEGTGEFLQVRGKESRLVPQPEIDIGQYLVVAGTARVQLPGSFTGNIPQTKLNIRMDVLIFPAYAAASHLWSL